MENLAHNTMPIRSSTNTLLSDYETKLFGESHTATFSNTRNTSFLSLIIKTTSTCNLSCKYCDADTYSNKRIQLITLENIIKNATLYYNTIDFIWHGGEPTLMGIDFYKKVVSIENRYNKEGQTIKNSIQTNGTLLNEEWVNFLIKNKFGIGISLDGQKIMHDSNRIFKNGTGSFDNVLKNINLLKMLKAKFGVLAVITEDTLKTSPKQFLNFFIENGLTNFGLNWQRPALNIKRDDHLQRSNYDDFMIGLFDAWYDIGDPNIHIREFDSIISKVTGGKKGFCILEGNCIGKYAGIAPNGDVFHCDEFMFDQEYKLGNIMKNSFHEILGDSNRRLQLLKEKNSNEINKLKCNWLKVCHGGCPKDRYVAIKSDNEPTCCGWGSVIDHIYNKIHLQ